MSYQNIKISVIIPVFNGAKTIEECVLSVVNQDYNNYEIIIVDNNSTDNTKSLINSLAGRFSNISYIFESRQGRGAARNAGVMAASGEIIAMTDSDCIVPNNWLSLLIKPIIENKSEVVSGFERDATSNYWSSCRQHDDWRFIQTKIKDGFTTHLDTKNFAIRADILKRLKFNSELIACEDWDLLIRLRLEGFKVYFLPNLLVAHYHDSSAKALINTQLAQGKSATFIINSYLNNPKFIEVFGRDESLNFFKLRNFILFIPWACWQFLYRPILAPYRVLSDLAWKIGVINAELIRVFKRK